MKSKQASAAKHEKRSEAKKGNRQPERAEPQRTESLSTVDDLINDLGLTPEAMDPLAEHLEPEEGLRLDPSDWADLQRKVERWLREHDTSPANGAKLAHKLLTPNLALRDMIRSTAQR